MSCHVHELSCLDICARLVILYDIVYIHILQFLISINLPPSIDWLID